MAIFGFSLSNSKIAELDSADALNDCQLAKRRE
jgi:hypothetical protein